MHTTIFMLLVLVSAIGSVGGIMYAAAQIAVELRFGEPERPLAALYVNPGVCCLIILVVMVHPVAFVAIYKGT